MPIEEESCGIIVFQASSKPKYLILHYEEGHWDFPKGHVEKGESEIETALRETREETGITDIEFIPDFRETIDYYYTRDGKKYHKNVFFFLGKTKTKKPTLSHEHVGFIWLDFGDALAKLTFDNAKTLLKKADSFLKKSD